MKWLLIILLLCGISFAQEDRQAIVTVSCGQILDYVYPKLDSLSDVDSTKLNRIDADLEVCAEYGQLAPATLSRLARSTHMIGFTLGIRALQEYETAQKKKHSAGKAMLQAFIGGFGAAAIAQANSPSPQLHCTVMNSPTGMSSTIDCY